MCLCSQSLYGEYLEPSATRAEFAAWTHACCGAAHNSTVWPMCMVSCMVVNKGAVLDCGLMCSESTSQADRSRARRLAIYMI